MHMKSKLGYAWAALGVPIMLVFIMGMEFWMNLLFLDPGVTYTERITGGEIKTVKDNGTYVTQIHEPVFEGCFKDMKKGFIQLDWITENSFPETIAEDVDYDSDGAVDFRLELNTDKNTAVLIPYRRSVRALSDERVMTPENQRTVRINLVREDL